jgi:hypothetical protein
MIRPAPRWTTAQTEAFQTQQPGGEMATKADFSEEEWDTLRKGATGAGLLVSVSDRGFFDSFKEAGALAKHMGKARESGTSDLVRELASGRGTGFGLTDRPDEVERETLEALRSAVPVLERKAPEDVESYRKFVLDVARSVGEAAGGGESAHEAETLEKIRTALGGGPA